MFVDIICEGYKSECFRSDAVCFHDGFNDDERSNSDARSHRVQSDSQSDFIASERDTDSDGTPSTSKNNVSLTQKMKKYHKTAKIT